MTTTGVDSVVLQNELTTLKSKFQQALAIIKTVRADNEALQAQVANSVAAVNSASQATLTSQLTAENDTLKKEKDELRAQIESMKVASAEQGKVTADLNLQVQSLTEKNTLSTQKIDSLSQKAVLLMTRFQQQAGQLEASVKELDGMKERVRELGEENAVLATDLANQPSPHPSPSLNAETQTQLDLVNAQCEAHAEQIAVLEQRNDELGEAVDQLEHQREDTDIQITTLEQQNETLTTRVAELQSHIDDKDRQIGDLDRQNVEHQATVAHYEQRLFETESKLDSMNASNMTTETIATELHQVLAQNSVLQRKLDSAMKLQETLQGDHQEEFTLLSQTHQNELAEQSTQFQLRLDEMVRDSEGLRGNHEKEKMGLANMIQNKDSTITQLLTQIESQSHSIHSLELRITQLDDNLHGVVVGHEQQLQMITLEHGEKCNQFLSTIKTLQHDLTIAQNQLEQLKDDSSAGGRSDVDGDLSSSSASLTSWQSHSGTSPRSSRSRHNNQSYNDNEQGYYDDNNHNDNHNDNHNNNNTSPSSRRGKNNQYIQEISKAAEFQRQIDSAQRDYQDAIKVLGQNHDAHKNQLFAYITSLRASLLTLTNYIEWLTQQLQAILLTQKRNGVDIDYVKNVLIRFILFQKLGLTSQQNAMIPVIGQLLHFSPDEIKLLKSAEERGKDFANKSSTWGSWLGGGGGGASRSFSEAFAHDLETDYDPMSSIQSQGVLLSQQSSVIEAKKEFQKEQDGLRREHEVEQQQQQGENPVSSGQQQPDPSTGLTQYLKPGRNLSSAGILNSIKDLAPPQFENAIPPNVARLGYSGTV